MGLQLCKSQWAVNQKINMYKLAILCVAIVGAFAAPNAEADADAYYGFHYPALYNTYPNWPGVSTPYSQSTCYGCYGKRSADAEPEADAYYGYGYAPYAYGYRRAYGYGYPYRYYGKRSADADAEPEADAAYYGYAAYAPYSYGYGL